MTETVKCPRCGKVHNCEPVDIDKIREKAAKDIADRIDNEIMTTGITEAFAYWTLALDLSPPTPEPKFPITGMMWKYQDSEGVGYKVYNGSEWVRLSDGSDRTRQK